jgi:hypothetical protein
MEEMKKLRALARDDRVIDLQERLDQDVQALWDKSKAAGYTDEEMRQALAALASNEYLRRRANAATDEHIRAIRRKRREDGSITLPLLRADQYLQK